MPLQFSILLCNKNNKKNIVLPFNYLFSNKRSKLLKPAVFRKNGTGENVVDEMVMLVFFMPCIKVKMASAKEVQLRNLNVYKFVGQGSRELHY